MTAIEFGDRLRTQRVAAGLTQEELARQAGVSVRTVRNVELGRDARPDSVRRLTEAVQRADVPEPRTQVRVLGPLTLEHAGRLLELGTAKQRCFFGLLAIQPGHPVGRDEIVAVLWGERPPHSHVNLVHTYAARLRRLLEGTGLAILADRTGYRLSTEAAEVDAQRFAELAERGGFAELTEALRLWRGEALADQPEELRAHPVVVELTQRRVTATLACADLGLAAGEAELVLDLVRPLANAEPLDERLHARLMLALAGTGAQAAALQVFAEIRHRLDRELGVQPGAELLEAQFRVLRQDVGARAPVVVPAQLPADVPDFHGRTAALTRLTELTGTPVVVISGMPGIGKTALAVHWAHRVRADFPDGQLQVNLRGYDPGPPLPPLRALARFLRALGVSAEAVPGDLDEAAALYRSLLADRKMLVLLDNAADAGQVRPLLPGSPGCLVLTTSRDRLDPLVAQDGARRLTLDVLPPAEAAALLRAMCPEQTAAEPRAVAELAVACAHLPLALRIAAADLLAHPHRRLSEQISLLRNGDGLTALTVGAQESAVREAFALSYRDLTDPLRRLFRRLALLPGPDFTPEVAAELMESSLPETQRLLARLSAAHLVQESAPGRHTLHDLIRLFAAECLAAEEPEQDREAARRRAFTWYVGGAHAAVKQLYPLHLPFPVPERADLAGTGAAAAWAWLEAERANLIAIVQQDPPTGWRLAAVLHPYFTHHGVVADWAVAAAAALPAAEAEGDAHGVVASLHSLADLGRRQCQSGEWAGHAGRMLRLSQDLGWMFGVLSARTMLAESYTYSGELDRAARAASVLIDAGEPTGMVPGLVIRSEVHIQRGDYLAAEADLLRFTELIVARDDHDGPVINQVIRGDVDLLLDRPEAALDHFYQARDLLGPHRRRRLIFAALRGLADALSRTAAHATAEPLARDAHAIAVTLPGPIEVIEAEHTLAMLAHRRGDADTAIRHRRRSLELARRAGHRYHEASALTGLAEAQQAAGQHPQARESAGQALELARRYGFGRLAGRAESITLGPVERY